MVVMKQIEQCLDKAFNKKLPAPSKKWKAFFHDGLLYVFHYHHLVLVYYPTHHQYLAEWWERPADKRGLDSAKEYLEARWRKLQENKV